MVLRSMQPPAWLNEDAPDNDVVISSRCRFARNLWGHRFPNHALAEELKEINFKVKEAATGLGLETFKRLSQAEREYMIGCRLMSPDFEGEGSNCSLMLNKSRSVSIMVNEEDHLRIQALTAGWSIQSAHQEAESILKTLGGRLRWASCPEWGFLAASPFNAGEGIRLSAMFHLVGLAHTKRLNEVLGALTGSGLVTRGLFGESSRAIGAFFQVSSIRSNLPRFMGACDYLMREERLARASVATDQLRKTLREAIHFGVVSKELAQVDALRILAWVRWGIAMGLEEIDVDLREVDAILSTLELRNNPDEVLAAKERAATLRDRFEHIIRS